jgi:hypothetical protein
MDTPTFISFLENTKGPAISSDLMRFEENIKATLPNNYRDFLVQVNGGSLPSGSFPNLLAFAVNDSRPLAKSLAFQIYSGTWKTWAFPYRTN